METQDGTRWATLARRLDVRSCGRRLLLGLGLGAGLLVLSGCPGDEVPPGPVTNLQVTASATTVDLSWTNPAEGYTGALVRRTTGTTPPASPTDGDLVVDMPWPDTTATDTGLTPSTTYTYAVFAHDSQPNHAPAATATITTAPVDAAWNLQATPQATSITLTWTGPFSPHTGVMIRRAPGTTPPAGPTDGTLVADLTAPTAFTHTDTGLSPVTTYSYAAFVHDATPTYASGATTTATTAPDVPGAPTIGTATAGNTTATLTWTAPTTNGGAPITGYTITPYYDGQYAYPARVFNSTATTQTITGLQNDVSWTFRVAATNTAGTGPQSGHSNAVTPKALVAQTAAGGSHTCALLDDGRVKCWGFNGQGQTAQSISILGHADPRPVTGISAGTGASISAGPNHTCVVLTAGGIRCWGYSYMGDGSTSTSRTPVAVSGITTAVAVDAGGNHTCAVLAAGTVRCWGINTYGQLGDGTTTARLAPVTVTGITNAIGVSAGQDHTCALLADGSLRCWGWGNYGQLGNGSTTQTNTTPVTVTGISTATSVSAGYYHTCARLADSTLRCWGTGQNGRLGTGSHANSSTPVAPIGVTGASEVSAGYAHTCARFTDGTASCWGLNQQGQIGDGTLGDRLQPGASLALSGVTSVSAGTNHTCARLADGSARCWGSNEDAQVGNGTVARVPTPTAVPDVATAVEAAGGGAHTCLRMTDGTVRCAGSNWSGQLGDGTTTSRSGYVAVAGVATAIDLSAGGDHTCAVLAAGTVRCWGSGSQGQLGNGTTANSSTPVAVTGITTAVAVSAGSSHTCAALSDGTVRCWGQGYFGQMGNGTTTGLNTTPVTVTGITTATSLAAGANHTCATVVDGTVRCWGWNVYGGLGDGTTTDRSTPVTVSGLAGATAVSAGFYHSCARVSDGTLRCWGYGGAGSLGNGSTTQAQTTPVTVTGISTAIDVAAGGTHTCARLTDGTVRCWGSHTHGQVGDGVAHWGGTGFSRTTPVAVVGLTDAASMAAGSNHTCAVGTDGTVRCWGRSSYGELGTGVDTWSPQTVLGI